MDVISIHPISSFVKKKTEKNQNNLKIRQVKGIDKKQMKN